MYPQFQPDEVDLPVDHSDLSRILHQSGKVLHDELDQVASRAQFVLSCMRHVADYGVTIDLPYTKEPEEHLVYLDSCTSTTEGVRWWVENVFLTTAPDWVDATGNEYHLKKMQSDTQLHSWIRNGRTFG